MKICSSFIKNEMVEWHQQLNGLEFEQTLGDSEGNPGILQSVGSQRVGRDLVAEQQPLKSRG